MCGLVIRVGVKKRRWMLYEVLLGKNFINNNIMSYKKLEVWQLSREISIKIHEVTLNQLPKFEMFEEGSQIRRSSKSVRSLIVEGYGKRYYKQDFIKYLISAIASNDETIDHLEILYETGSLTDVIAYHDLFEKINLLGKKLNFFIEAVKKEHISVK
jgi:four helix bundle protein